MHSVDSAIILILLVKRVVGFFFSMSLRYWLVVIRRLSELGLNPVTERIRNMISRSRRLKKTLVMVLRLEKNSERAFMAAAEESAKDIAES